MNAIEQLENQYSELRKKYGVITSEITDIISMMELDNIKELILDAKEKIETYSKTGRISDKIKNLPVIGNMYTKLTRIKNENSNVGEVVKTLFDSFIVKQNRILELMEMLEKMEKKLLKQNSELEILLEEIENTLMGIDLAKSEQIRAKRLATLIKINIIKNNDKINSKIKPALVVAEKTLENMTLLLPSLREDLVDELGINGTLNSIKDMNQMLKETIELTKIITEESQKRTEELIIDTIKLTQSKDTINYIVESEKKRKKFVEKLQNEILNMEKQVSEEYKMIGKIYSEKQKLLKGDK
jgi:hypothetical protein